MALDPRFDLFGRSFLSLRDYTAAEIEHLLQLSAMLKQEKREHREHRRLEGRNIALIFEKDSTRTRIGFEVAAYDQGAHVTYLGPTGSHVGKKESVKDTARVLGRVYDAIEFRGYRQSDVEALAQYSGVPVYNGLTDDDHPTQVLADLLTIREHVAKPLADVALAYVGDARSNMGNEILIGCAIMGLDLRIVAPKSVWPREEFLTWAQEHAEDSGARITVTEDVTEGVRGADVLYTDVWVSMGEPEAVWDERIALLRPYQVERRDGGRHWQPGRQVHALPAGLPRSRDGGRTEDVRAPRPHRDGGHRRGVRVAGIDRLRPGREPDAHDQGRHGGHAPPRRRGLKRVVAAPGAAPRLPMGAASATCGERPVSAGARPRGDPLECACPAGLERAAGLVEVDHDGRVVRRRRRALARLAVDLGPDHPLGHGCGRVEQVDPHALVLVEHAGAVVPPGEPPALGLCSR